MTYTVFNVDTGKITSVLSAPLSDIHLNIEEGFQAVFGEYSPDEYYILNNEAIRIPDRPSPHHTFDYGAKVWIDPRTPADLAAALIARRNATVLDKSELLIRLRSAQILTSDEAKVAGRGEIPARLMEMMGPLPEDARDAAEIKWAADTTISRTHPVIVTAAYALGISDEQLDQIFGVAA